jgi:hypothetical protein
VPLKDHDAFHSPLLVPQPVVPYYSSSSLDCCVSSNVSSVHPTSRTASCSQEIDRRVVSLPYGFEYVSSDARDGEKPYRTADTCRDEVDLGGHLHAFPHSSVASY